jgi:four helix bundle protein
MTTFGTLSMARRFDLEERLIRFPSSIIQLSEMLPQTFAGRHIAGQMIRSGTAPALHYGEAQSGESRKAFIHKMKVALKELRETFNALKIVDAVSWLPSDKLEAILDENNQLISIFVRSIETATTNDQQKRGVKKKAGTH